LRGDSPDSHPLNREKTHVKDDLIKLSEYLNLQVIELRSCDHMLQGVSAAIRPAYLLVTGIFAGWKDSWLLVARKRDGWRPSRTLPQDQLARIPGIFRVVSRTDWPLSGVEKRE
jgi:hypothetical protein